jgi:hypothetical protein
VERDFQDQATAALFAGAEAKNFKLALLFRAWRLTIEELKKMIPAVSSAGKALGFTANFRSRDRS